MKDTLKYIVLLAAMVISVYGYHQLFVKPKEQRLQAELNKQKIQNDTLTKIADGYYTKLVADTLTQKQLKKLAEEVIELKNRKPVSVTKTVIQPVRIEKETDTISEIGDSIFITDSYPDKENPFLKYTNRFSLVDKKGVSEFDFSEITLSEVVTKKEDGLYQIDFKGPDFLEVKSINIQTEPQKKNEKDNSGILVGLNIEKDFTNNSTYYNPNAYYRFKKFYIGGGASTKGSGMFGIKIEL